MTDSDDEMRSRIGIRDRLVGCIPTELIQTDQIKAIRAELDATGGPPANVPPFQISSGRVSEEERLQRQGVNLDDPAVQECRSLKEAIKGFCKDDNRRELTAEKCEQILPTVKRFAELLEQAEELKLPAELTGESGVDLIHACAAQMAFAADLSPETEVGTYVREKLFEAGLSARPGPSEQDERWETELQGWGSPQSRIEGAEGLMALAGNKAFCDQDLLDQVMKLANDPVPAVRHQIISRCLFLRETSPETMRNMIGHVAENETALGILHFFVAGVLEYLPPDDVHALVTDLFERHRNRDTDLIRGRCAVFFLRRALWEQHASSEERIAQFVADPLEYIAELDGMVSAAASLILYEEDDQTPEECQRVRSWILGLYRDVVRSAQKKMADIRSTQADCDKWTDAATENYRSLYHLADSVVHRLRFTAANEDKSVPGGILERFVQEADELLEALCDLPHVRTAYDLVGLLGTLVDANPRRVLELLHKCLGASKPEGIHYEHMAATRVVEIIEGYLAGHKELLAQEQPQGHLLDILDAFVEAGWTEADELTYRLSEVFR